MADDRKAMEGVSLIFRFIQVTATEAVRLYFQPMRAISALRGANREFGGGTRDKLRRRHDSASIVQQPGDGLDDETKPESPVAPPPDSAPADVTENTLLESHLQLYSGPDVDQTFAETLETLNADLLDYLRRDRSHWDVEAIIQQVMVDVFARAGLSVRQATATRDREVDVIVVERPGVADESIFLVQCKRRAGKSVSLDVVRSLWASRATPSVSNGLLATTSSFRHDKEETGTSEWNLSLQDYKVMLDWINSFQPNPEGIFELEGEDLVVTPRS